MSSPLYDAFSIKHSRNIGDTVDAAATDGDIWSSAQRDTHINTAIRIFVRKMLIPQSVGNLVVKVRDTAAIAGYMNRESKALSGSALTLATSGGWTGGVAWILSARNGTQAADVKPIPPELLANIESGVNSYTAASATNQYFYVSGGNFNLLGGAATDAIILHYIKPHTNMTAGAASDWLIAVEYEDIIAKLAYAEALRERPNQENDAKRIQAENMAFQGIL